MTVAGGLLSPGSSWRASGRRPAQEPALEGVGAAHGPNEEARGCPRKTKVPVTLR